MIVRPEGQAPFDLEPSIETQRGMPVDLHRIIRTFWIGRWWLLGAAMLGLALGLVYAKFIVGDEYVSNAVLKFDPRAELRSSAHVQSPREAASYLDAVLSDPVLREVRRRLRSEAPLSVLAKRLDVGTDFQSDIIRIKGTGRTPEEATRLTSTASEVFLAYLVGRQRDRIESETSVLVERIRAGKAALAAARRAHQEFREKHGIADLDVEQERNIQNAAELRADASLVKSEIASLEARIVQLEQDLKRTPEMITANVSSSPEVEELARMRTELARARGYYSDQHPRVRALEQQVQGLEKQSRSARGSISQLGTNAQHASLQSALATARADLEAARKRQVELFDLAEAAQERVAAYSDLEGEASKLLAEVRVNEELTNELTAELARMQDMSPKAPFRVVSPASEPDSPEANKRKLLAAGAMPFGLIFLGMVGLLTREFRGFRVRTATEVGFWGKGPVVSTTTWPRDPYAFNDFIADMDDFAPDAEGHTLVVGATESERPIAMRIAAGLNADWMPTALIPSGLEPRGSKALTLRTMSPVTPRVKRFAEGWDGPSYGQALRRAARLSDRVLVVVTSNEMSAFDVAQIRTRLGRDAGVGFVLIGIDPEFSTLADRAGRVEDFWYAKRE